MKRPPATQAKPRAEPGLALRIGISYLVLRISYIVLATPGVALVVKNKRKDNGYYWVHANISGVYKDGELVEYKSLRSPVDRETKIRMQNVYDALRKNEEKSSRVVLYVSDAQLEEIEKIL